MVVEEYSAKWTRFDRYQLNDVIFHATIRVQIMLRQETPRQRYHMHKAVVLAIAEIIGKEVRRARYYKDMTAEEIIEALDVAYKILKVDD